MSRDTALLFKSVTKCVIHTPLGPVALKASPYGLASLEYLHGTFTLQAGDLEPPETGSLLDQASTELQEYFNGQRRDFSVALAPEGTPFERRVWQALLEIPYGSVKTYREQALKAGFPKACRATGRANGKNPLPIFIPCHRVIRSDGTLGGYSSGVALKQKLLDLERSLVETDAGESLFSFS